MPDSKIELQTTQRNALKLDDTQLILNAVEHLPLFTNQLLKLLCEQPSNPQFERLLYGLHQQLTHLSHKAEAMNYVRLSEILEK